jgi:hypothetical protein
LVVTLWIYENPDRVAERVLFNDDRSAEYGRSVPGVSRTGTEMDVAYISALSALAGSVIGGLSSGITAWLNQRSLARAGQLAHEHLRRQELYTDFIVAASKTYGEALVVNEPKIEELIALYAMISRMRVLSSPDIVACAERVLFETTGAYFEPNRTVPELRELIRTGTGVDPLKDFAEAVREEHRRFAYIT